ncbi:hypothetical protein M5K25_024267 [Dendrobium thyrsiflorum]|uniref:Uncharacterized protein n=1 Tax=Dendrobium thyrsiflorum TaxID=117978 RepID=A0ABD0U1H8_DENTH
MKMHESNGILTMGHENIEFPNDQVNIYSLVTLKLYMMLRMAKLWISNGSIAAYNFSHSLGSVGLNASRGHQRPNYVLKS